MAVTHIGRLAGALALALTLGGCQEGAGPGGLFGAAKKAPEAASADAAAPALSVVEKDMPAPDVFNVTDQGLWDGRPSLGGVWVAHGSVKDPERVMIRNPENGNSVIGALFRRETANPGPAIQVSSDAAAALGMLAGAPAKLEVVALRRQEMPEATPADPTEFPPAPTDPVIAEAAVAAADGAETGAADIAATASAAIDKAEGAAPATDVAATDAVTATDAAVAEAAAVPEKKCPFWRKKKCEAERAAAAAAMPATDVAAAVDGTAIAAAPLPDAIAATPAAAGTLTRAYVQIGIFSIEANAQRAADQMKAKGMVATVKTDQSQGKTFWRVIVGPAASVAERDALAQRVKDIGYPDAYPVSK